MKQGIEKANKSFWQDGLAVSFEYPFGFIFKETSRHLAMASLCFILFSLELI